MRNSRRGFEFRGKGPGACAQVAECPTALAAPGEDTGLACACLIPMPMPSSVPAFSTWVPRDQPLLSQFLPL